MEKALPMEMHKKQRQVFTRVMQSLLDDPIQLTITELGRCLVGKTSIKHKIKAADRFIGNTKVDLVGIRKGLAQVFFGNFKELIINVDWTGACLTGYHMLQASVVMKGRSIPIYEEQYDEKQAQTAKAHTAFLEGLLNVVPANINVVITTDAGFHREWFSKIQLLGWDFIGRVYSRYYYCEEGTIEWKRIGDIEFASQGKATRIGKVKLGKTNRPLEGYLYSYKGKLSGKPHKKNCYPSHEKMYSNYYRNGWVIFSSLKKGAQALVRFYRSRMQIEQNFKDIKNEQLGLGLRRHQSMTAHRGLMLYFVGMVLLMLLWWIGFMVEIKKKHWSYQASSIKSKRIISLIKLARLFLRNEPDGLSWQQLILCQNYLQQYYLSYISMDSFDV
jgi:hypothetical protein